MKKIGLVALSAVMLVGSIYADGFGFNLGPFSVQFNAPNGDYVAVKRNVLDEPICQAIVGLKQLELTLETRETLNTKEQKVVTKSVIVEPYAFGITREGKPVLKGVIVDEKLVREVTVKYGEETFDEPDTVQKKSYFSGLFSSDKSQNIDIRKVVDVQIIPGSHFEPPKPYNGVKDQNFQVICQLPVTI